ncbi:hypothetical protein R6Q59_018088 [Mikania micrantha]
MKPLSEREIERENAIEVPAPDEILGEPFEVLADDNKIKKLEDPVEEDTSSVEIISYGHCFSPYKSQLHRQFSKEDRKMEMDIKQMNAFLKWRWDLVINVDELEDVSQKEEGGYEADLERSDESINYGSMNDLTESSEQFHDTADSLESVMQIPKIPRVTIHSRTRVKHCLSYV